MFLIFWLLSYQDDLLIDFEFIVARFGGRTSTKNRSKLNQKCDQKSNAIWDVFWVALEPVLERFWAQVAGQVGTKLAPKSEK